MRLLQLTDLRLTLRNRHQRPPPPPVAVKVTRPLSLMYLHFRPIVHNFHTWSSRSPAYEIRLGPRRRARSGPFLITRLGCRGCARTPRRYVNTSASSGGQVLFESLWESMIGLCEIRGGKVSLPRVNSNFPLSF